MPEDRWATSWQDDNPARTDDKGIRVSVPDVTPRKAGTSVTCNSSGSIKKETEDEKIENHLAEKHDIEEKECNSVRSEDGSNNDEGQRTAEESESNEVYQWLDYFN